MRHADNAQAFGFERVDQLGERVRAGAHTEARAQAQEIGQPRRQHRGGHERDAAGVECFLRLRQARAGHDAEFAQDIGRRDAAVAAQRPVDQHRHTEALQQECQ